jgi:hypothetical protein
MGATYAGILGSLAFVVFLIRGAIHGSSAESVLLPGIVCLIAFAAVGYVAGRIAEQIVIESVTVRFNDELKNRETKKVADAKS